MIAETQGQVLARNWLCAQVGIYHDQSSLHTTKKCNPKTTFSRLFSHIYTYISTCVLSRHNKLSLKQNNDIVVYEDLSGEVRFSKHLPQPNNLNR